MSSSWPTIRIFDLFDLGSKPARKSVEKNPDLVQRFVDASDDRWYHYLYGDNSKANAAIKKDNPELTDEQIGLLGRQDEGIRHRRFRRFPLKLGIGAMTDERR